MEARIVTAMKVATTMVTEIIATVIVMVIPMVTATMRSRLHLDHAINNRVRNSPARSSIITAGEKGAARRQLVCVQKCSGCERSWVLWMRIELLISVKLFVHFSRKWLFRLQSTSSILSFTWPCLQLDCIVALRITGLAKQLRNGANLMLRTLKSHCRRRNWRKKASS